MNSVLENLISKLKDNLPGFKDTVSTLKLLLLLHYGIIIKELSSLIAVVPAKTGESGSEIGHSLATVFENLQDINNNSVTKLFDSINVSMTVRENGTERLKTPIELLKELVRSICFFRQQFYSKKGYYNHYWR